MHLMANVGDMILRTIENCGPHVDAIYVGYSPTLWGYIDHGLKNQDGPEILKRSRWFGKVRLVEGSWKLDEEERNAVRDAAIRDGMDVLVIQDTDEFYDDFGGGIVADISERHECAYYLAESVLLWKNLWRLYGQDGNPVEQTFECAIGLHNPETTFKRCRRPDLFKKLTFRKVRGIFHHAAYCRTPEQMGPSADLGATPTRSSRRSAGSTRSGSAGRSRPGTSTMTWNAEATTRLGPMSFLRTSLPFSTARPRSNHGSAY